jgi:hypothetical protein
MMLDHRALHRMRLTIGVRQMLDRQELFAVESGREHNARINGAVVDGVSRRFAKYNCTRTAIAFGATLFRANEFLDRPEIVEDRHRWAEIPRIPRFPAQYEVRRLAHQSGRRAEP